MAARQRAGAEEIKEALEAGKSDSIRPAIAGRANFKREFRDFAFWNLNINPFKRYTDTPGFPDVVPSAKSVKQKEITAIGSENLGLNLDKLGMEYHYLTFPNDKVKYIEFLPADFTGNLLR